VEKGDGAPVTSLPSSSSSCSPLSPTSYSFDGAMHVAEGVSCYNKHNHFRLVSLIIVDISEKADKLQSLRKIPLSNAVW
jgi:hypothetical protein